MAKNKDLYDIAKKKKASVQNDSFEENETIERKSRGTRRKNDFRIAQKKRNKCKNIYQHEYYDNLHEYSKGKIHCSCPICRQKTNLKKCGIVASDIYGNREFDYYKEQYKTKARRFHLETVLEKTVNDPRAFGVGATVKSAQSWHDRKEKERMDEAIKEFFELGE